MWTLASIQKKEVEVMIDVKTGVDLITEERARQVSEEGWTPAHDDEHVEDELAMAALCYAYPSAYTGGVPIMWPWDKKWWKPKGRVIDLVRAGALIAAEIDRLQRRKGEG